MKKFTEIREARRSAQDRLSARAKKHGLGSQKRLDKIKKSSDFFSKPPPSFTKDELKKMGYAVEGRFDIEIPAPKGMKDRKNPTRTALNKKMSAKHSDKITKNAKRDQARSARSGGALTRKGHNGKSYKNGHAGKFFSNHPTFESASPAQQAMVDEAYYRGQRRATPKKQEPPKMGSKSGSGYDLYHKSYSGALQHAYAWAKKKGYTVDPDDIDSKVASGPKKPSEGRTNSFTLKLKDNPKKMLAVQVYGMGGGKYELNTYIT